MEETLIQYNKEKFRKGGIYAALIPIALGLTVFIAILAYAQLDKIFYEIPIMFSFVFIAPIVATLSVSELKRRAPFTREEVLQVGIRKASLANLYVAIIYNFALAVILIKEASNNGIGIIALFSLVFIIGGIIQFVLWLFITVPLTMLCTMIFEKVVISK